MKKAVIGNAVFKQHRIGSYLGMLSLCLAIVAAMNACTMNDVREPGLCGYGKTDDDLGTLECQCAPAVSGTRETPILDQCSKFIPKHSVATDCTSKYVCQYECEEGYQQSSNAAECVPVGEKNSCKSEYVCKGSDQYRCSDDKLIESCEYGCDHDTGTCLSKSCKSDDVKCSDAKERVFCQDGEWQKESCQKDEKCVDGSCIHWVCDDDARQCRDNVPQKCVDHDWVDSEPCELGCDARTGVCLTPGCTDGDVKCYDEKTKVVCREGTWQTELCQKNEKCIDNACVASGCENDTLRCNQNVVQKCIDYEWVDQETCKGRCIENQCIDCDASGTCVYIKLSTRTLDIAAGHSQGFVVSYIIDEVPQIGKNVSIQMSNPNCIEVVNAVALETEYTTVQVTGKPVEADCFSDIIIRDDLAVAKSVMIRANVHPLVDENHNYMIDEFDLKDGAECKKDSDCDSGFCDSFIGYRCSYRCMADDQCISDKYFCRPDGRCAPKVFETVWNITAGGKTNALSFPIRNATACNFTIEWGDGESETVTSCPGSDLRHEYSAKGEYHIKVTGTLDGWAKHNENNPCNGNYISYLEQIESFGPVGLGMGAFANATEFKKMSPVDIPDATKLTSTSGMFCRSEVKTNGWYFINNWDMSNVKDMSYMFNNNNTFNQEIGSWNTENVKNMSYMFFGTKLFNQDIGKWDTSNVENMSNMFRNAIAFNQDIGKWNVSNVEDMSYMFYEAKEFNQNIGSWDLSNAENMSYMFWDTEKFNQDIGKWNVSNVEDMGSMFERAKAFNQDIGGWDVSNVRNMRYMFEDAAAFHQNLSGWKLSSSPDTSYMFSGSAMSKENFCAMKNAESTWWKYSASSYGLNSEFDTCAK